MVHSRIIITKTTMKTRKNIFVLSKMPWRHGVRGDAAQGAAVAWLAVLSQCKGPGCPNHNLMLDCAVQVVASRAKRSQEGEFEVRF